MPRADMLETADSVVAEQYKATDILLYEFREYFPTIMSATEYAESLPGEDMAIEQPPTAKEFVEQALATDSSSSEEGEAEG